MSDERPICLVPPSSDAGLPQCQVASLRPPAPPVYDPLHVQSGIIFGTIVVCVMLVRLIYLGRHKAEQGATFLTIWAMISLILGQGALGSSLCAAAVGCAFAANVRAPAWLWRAVGSRDGLCMGGTVGIGLLGVIAFMDRGDIGLADIRTVLTVAIAGAIFLTSAQGADTSLLARSRNNAMLGLSGIILSGLRSEACVLPIAIVLVMCALANQTSTFMEWWRDRLVQRGLRGNIPVDGPEH